MEHDAQCTDLGVALDVANQGELLLYANVCVDWDGAPGISADKVRVADGVASRRCVMGNLRGGLCACSSQGLRIVPQAARRQEKPILDRPEHLAFCVWERSYEISTSGDCACTVRHGRFAYREQCCGGNKKLFAALCSVSVERVRVWCETGEMEKVRVRAGVMPRNG